MATKKKRSKTPPKEVTIGKQVWMTENLNVDKFRNGDPIPQAQTKEEWENARKQGMPAWCYYNNDPTIGKNYGKLYNWFAVIDPRGLAPEGWDIPSDDDWTQLVDYVASQGHQDKPWYFNGPGKALKSKRCSTLTHYNAYKMEHPRWNISQQMHHAVDNFGFSALPGGYRVSSGGFGGRSLSGYWWSATESSATKAWTRAMESNRHNVYPIKSSKRNGHSVRCVRNVVHTEDD